jgi:alpha-ketoglutarate-dependent taurine dioxygenase
MTPASPSEIDVRQTWTRATLGPRDWLVPVPPACGLELDAALARLRETPRPLETLSPAGFDLSACVALMDRVRDQLTHGEGLVVLDRLPVERYSEHENRQLAWLLAAMLGPVVAQKWDGTRVYDVKDSGQALGYGVRRSVTNLEQPFHTDGGWLSLTPGLVGLFCLDSAEEGGMSRFVSLATAHERLRERHPELLERLYRAFWWDRQAEHAPEDTRVSAHPVFARDGDGLAARYYEDYVVKGHALAGEPLDAAGTAALAALREVIDSPELWVEFRIEKGQFQYLNNRRFAHCRTGFADGHGERRRHMLRFWNRKEGTTHLEGQCRKGAT